MSTKRKTDRFKNLARNLPTEGLTALIAPPATPPRQTELLLDQITPDENQPRRVFDKDSLNELTASITSRGVLQPIRVKPYGDTYKIISGERRYRAAKAAGLQSIPAVIETRADYTELDSAIDALVENLQREDLNVVDEVEGIFQLVKLRAEVELGKNAAKNLDYQAVEQALNRMRNAPSTDFEGVEALIATTTNDLGLSWKTLAVKKSSVWRWPADVLNALRSNQISLRVATVLKSISDDKARAHWLKEVTEGQFSASTLRSRIRTAELRQRPTIKDRVPALRSRLEALLANLDAGSTEDTEAALEQVERLEAIIGTLETLIASTNSKDHQKS